MPKIDLERVPVREGSGYPPPLDAEVAGRKSIRVGDAGGLTQFGANIVILPPGAKSSLRHWHHNEDEFLMVIAGTPTLIDDTGETPLAPFDCCAFPAGEANGHHVVNASESEARFLVVGTRAPEEIGEYSGVDLRVHVRNGRFTWTRRDGSPL